MHGLQCIPCCSKLEGSQNVPVIGDWTKKTVDMLKHEQFAEMNRRERPNYEETQETLSVHR